MADFELRFTAAPELAKNADKDLMQQWEQKFQKLVVGRVEVKAEIPKQTLTKLRNQFVQIENDLGRSMAGIERDVAEMSEKYGKAFNLTGVAEKFNVDMINAMQKHEQQVQKLESDYVNLKAMMREAAQTKFGASQEKEIEALENQIAELGAQIRRVFNADELEHFNRTMGELGGKGAGQVVGIQEFADSISGLRTRIVELAGDGERLVRITQEWDGKQWINTSTQIQDKTQKLRDEFKKFKKQVEALEDRFKLSETGSSYAQNWVYLLDTLETFDVEAPDARKQLEELQKIFVDTQNSISNSGSNLSRYKQKLKDVREAEVSLKIAKLESHGLRTTEVIQLQNVVDQRRAEAEQIKKTLLNTDKLTDAEEASAKSEEKLRQELAKTDKEWKKQHSLISNISAGFADATARIINYTSVYRAMWLVISKFKQSIQVAEDLNKAFTSIEMVTMSTADSMRELRQEYADLAVEMSSTLTDVAEGADSWLRQGKTAEETGELIKATMVMSRIGAIDAAESAEYLTSVLNGYKIATEDVMHVVDAMSQVDIESASSVDDLAIALQRSANVSATAGISFERLLGYVATVREVTQRSASVVGESLKTIISRMGSVKAGTFLSEDLESEYEDITTYVNDVEKVLTKVGIRLRDTNQDFRDTQDVLDDIAARWETFTDLEKQGISTAVAGKKGCVLEHIVIYEPAVYKLVRTYSNR